MDIPDKHNWFNLGAIVPSICVLFSFLFCLFVGPVMTPVAEVLWVSGIIVIATLVWFNSAKIAQETERRERDMIAQFKELKQLIEKPGTDFEDIRRAAADIDESFSKTPFARRATQAEIINRWWK